MVQVSLHTIEILAMPLVKVNILKPVHTYDDDVFIGSIIWNGHALDSEVSHAGPHRETSGRSCVREKLRQVARVQRPQPLLKHQVHSISAVH